MTASAFLMFTLFFTIGFYLILSQRFSHVLFGIALSSNAVNLLIIQTSKNQEGGVDPLPQALILTAIVISFGLIAFFAAYILSLFDENGDDQIRW